MCSKSLRGMAIVKLYKNIKISEASAAPENRFLMRCTVSGVHLTGGIKGNCKDELDNLIQEFMSFAYCFVSEIMKKYPNGGYDREKLLPYLKTLMPAEAPKN